MLGAHVKEKFVLFLEWSIASKQNYRVPVDKLTPSYSFVSQ
jgi:hypothetical protein